jgi:DNA-binding CsgD family transcriptional regulator
MWIVRAVPPRRKVGVSQREASLALRPRKLDADRRVHVAALAAQGRTLREIAAEVGVSHETVRAALAALRLAA